MTAGAHRVKLKLTQREMWAASPRLRTHLDHPRDSGLWGPDFMPLHGTLVKKSWSRVNMPTQLQGLP